MSSLDEGQRELLFAHYGRHYQAGDAVFAQDEPGEEVYVLQEGRVRLVKRVRFVERNLVILKPGDLFGESALLEAEPRPCSALALTDCAVLAFSASTFDHLVRSQPELATRMMRQLVKRLRDAEDQIENMLIRDNQSKVINTLLKLSHEAAGPAAESASLEISPIELSSRVGLDVETVKRSVQQLREGEYLRVADERLEIPSVESLRTLYRLLGMKEDLKRA